MLAFAPTRISDSRRPRHWHAHPTCTRPYFDLYDTTLHVPYQITLPAPAYVPVPVPLCRTQILMGD